MIKSYNKCDISDAIHIQNFVKESGARFIYTDNGMYGNKFNYCVEFETSKSYEMFSNLINNHFNPQIYTEKPTNKLKIFMRKLLQLF
jgi:glycogen debranching enzyme